MKKKAFVYEIVTDNEKEEVATQIEVLLDAQTYSTSSPHICHLG